MQGPAREPQILPTVADMVKTQGSVFTSTARAGTVRGDMRLEVFVWLRPPLLSVKRSVVGEVRGRRGGHATLQPPPDIALCLGARSANARPQQVPSQARRIRPAACAPDHSAVLASAVGRVGLRLDGAFAVVTQDCPSTLHAPRP